MEAEGEKIHNSGNDSKRDTGEPFTIYVNSDT